MGPATVRAVHRTTCVLAVVLLAACDADRDFTTSLEGDMCIIPTSDIHNGGPGKDGIPALTNPVAKRQRRRSTPPRTR